MLMRIRYFFPFLSPLFSFSSSFSLSLLSLLYLSEVLYIIVLEFDLDLNLELESEVIARVKSHITNTNQKNPKPQLLDHLEPLQTPGGLILDWHACDLYPERWIDLVVVVRCSNDVLHDRLRARGYGDAKIGQNIDSEIFGLLAEEARESYPEEIVMEVESDGGVEGQVEENVERIEGWVQRWRKERRVEGKGEGKRE